MIFIKDDIVWIRKVAMGNIFGPMAGCIKEIFRMILEMDMDNFFKENNLYTEDSGEKARKCHKNHRLIW